MEQIYKLKKWLSLDDATKCIGSILGAPHFSKADLYQLALDDKIKLSINLVNHAKARLGTVINLSESFDLFDDRISENPILDWKSLPSLNNQQEVIVCRSQKLTDFKYVTFESSVSNIKGIWDLAMAGNERIDIEYKFHQLTSGVEVELVSLDGTFLISTDGQLAANLLENYEDNEYCFGSEAYRKRNLTDLLDKGYDPAETTELLHKWSERREELKQLWYEKPETAYFNAGGIGEDAVLVVRVEAIQDFELSLMQPNPKNQLTSNEINPRLETTYLNIIGGLLHLMTNNVEPMPRTVNQEWIIQSLGSRVQGMSKANLTKYFPKAKASFDRAKKPN